MAQKIINLELIDFKISQLIEQYEKNCEKMEKMFADYENRISCLEKKWSWGKGLLAGMGVVTISTLIKLFFNIP